MSFTKISTSLVFYCLLWWLGTVCNFSPSSTSPNNSSITDTLPTTLTLQKHQIPIIGHLDDKVYVQLLDTTSLHHIHERTSSPVYECSCSEDGNCTIELGHPGTVHCVPTANGCKAAPNHVAINKDHSCSFNKIPKTHLTAQLENVFLVNLDYIYGRKAKTAKEFDEQGIRSPDYYTIELESSKQLIGLYTLNNGQQIVEYQPKNALDPIRVTCACSCVGGSACDMRVISSTQISCRPQTNCMPVTNGDPCDGCRLERVRMNAQDMKNQVKHKQLFKEK